MKCCFYYVFYNKVILNCQQAHNLDGTEVALHVRRYALRFLWRAKSLLWDGAMQPIRTLSLHPPQVGSPIRNS